MTDEKDILLGVANIAEADRLKTMLTRRDVKVTVLHNPETCKKGCSPTVEVWVSKDDMPKLESFFKEQRDALFDGLEVDPELMNQTFDVSKDEAVCPACGTKFSTKENECPDCGLMFSIPEEAE